MKQIIVTGSEGGTGPSIVSALREKGYDVIAIDIHPWTESSAPGYICLDLRDAAGLNDVFALADGVKAQGRYPLSCQHDGTALVAVCRLGVTIVTAGDDNTGYFGVGIRQIQICRDVVIRLAGIDDLFNVITGG